MNLQLERIRELRDTGMSMFEAKKTVERQDLDVEIRNAKNLDDIRAILWTLNNR